MKKFKLTRLLLTLLLMAVASSVFAELKIIKLSYSKPEVVIKVLNQLYGKRIDAASAPSINAVVINTNDPSILEEIDKLTKVLDRRPSILKFSIKRSSNSNQTNRFISLAKKSRFKHTNSKNQQNSIRSVIALEYKKARFTDDLVRIFHTHSWLGNQTHSVTTSHGLSISGHLTDKEHAQIEVWYSSGKEFESETLLTSLNAPLGQWMQIGGSSRESSDNSPRIQVSPGKPEYRLNKNSGHLDRCYLIKVDLVRY